VVSTDVPLQTAVGGQRILHLSYSSSSEIWLGWGSWHNKWRPHHASYDLCGQRRCNTEGMDIWFDDTEASSCVSVNTRMSTR